VLPDLPVLNLSPSVKEPASRLTISSGCSTAPTPMPVIRYRHRYRHMKVRGRCAGLRTPTRNGVEADAGIGADADADADVCRLCRLSILKTSLDRTGYDRIEQKRRVLSCLQ
jgi:hypothetical protein